MIRRRQETRTIAASCVNRGVVVAGRYRRWAMGIAVVAMVLLFAAASQAADSIVTVDSTGHTTANSLVLDAAGNPVIAYSDITTPEGEVKLTHCSDPNCANPVTPSPVVVGHAEKESLALDASGNPVIAYWTNPLSESERTIYFYAAVGFLAGFSERWARVIIGGVTGGDDEPQQNAAKQTEVSHDCSQEQLAGDAKQLAHAD